MSETRIIIKKKKAPHAEGHHGGAWKVAYADLVTAMMAFFLVMWLITQGQETKESVAAYFSDPIGFAKQAAAGSGMMPGSPDLEKSSPPEEGEVQEELRKKALEVQLEIRRLQELEDLEGEVVAEVEPAGLRIRLQEADESTFFGLGSDELSENGIQALQAIGKVIAPLDYDIVLEGHTDSKTYRASMGYTNWELSTDRANAARRVLERAGVESNRLALIQGFADTKPRFPKNPLDPRNRRIEILVKNPLLASEDSSKR
jgi:chemotaxis protein MotB